MRALVLSSGGIDSTTCLALAIKKYGVNNVISVSIDYGQKHNKELICAKEISEFYGIEHITLNLKEIFKYSNNALMQNSTKKVPKDSYAEQLRKTEIVDTYVPFRNGLFLSAISSLALAINNNERTDIYIGVHLDDAAGRAYADCTKEFIETISKAISLGTYEKIKIITPFVYSNKAEIVRVGLNLKAPYHLTWSCYQGGEKQCGECATCIDRKEAFKKNEAIDPVAYKR